MSDSNMINYDMKSWSTKPQEEWFAYGVGKDCHLKRHAQSVSMLDWGKSSPSSDYTQLGGDICV